jgi:hypothetical protein
MLYHSIRKCIGINYICIETVQSIQHPQQVQTYADSKIETANKGRTKYFLKIVVYIWTLKFIRLVNSDFHASEDQIEANSPKRLIMHSRIHSLIAWSGLPTH